MISFDKSLKLYNEILSYDTIHERKGKTMPYTPHNTYMYTFLTKEGHIALRLPKEVIENFMSKYETKLVEQHGKVMKEFVIVPQRFAEDKEMIKKYLQISFDYVTELKPKPKKK